MDWMKLWDSKAVSGLRWILFLPLSLGLAAVLSGLVEIAVQFFCGMNLFGSFVGGCDYDSSRERSFVSEVVFLWVFLEGIYWISPKYKKRVMSICAIVLGFVYVLLPAYAFFNGLRWSSTLLFLGIASFGYGIYNFRDSI